MKSIKNLISGFIIFVIVVCLLIFLVENINHKFFLNDFKVYYLAAKALISDQQVYGVAFSLGSGYYKYSPLILMFFIPFTFLPYQVAAIIFYVLIVIAIIVLFTLLRKLLNRDVFEKNAKQQNLIYSLAFVFVLNQIYRELHLGNTNVILLVMIFTSLMLTLQSKSMMSGVFFGIAILFKPFFLILILPLLLFRKWKELLSAMSFIAVFFLLFMVIFGFSFTFDLNHQWIASMMGHSDAFPAENTLDYIVRLYTQIKLPGSFQYIIIAMTGLLYLLFALFTYKKIKQRKKPAELNLIFGFMVLLAVLPNIVKTDTEHFLYALPLIVFMTYYLVIHKNWWLRIIFIILFLLHGTNSNDMVGRYLSDKMSYYGILGISNLMLIAFGIYLIYKQLQARRPGEIDCLEKDSL